MLNLITAAQMRDADLDCIESSRISSVDLMERAARAFVGVFCGLVSDKKKSILVLCGTGNNGGDGLAVARLLRDAEYSKVRVSVIPTAKNESFDFLANLKFLERNPIRVDFLNEEGLRDPEEDIIVDALLGSGLDRPLSGTLKRIVELINKANKYVVAIDCPSGFSSEGKLSDDSVILKADEVISFQRPKLNFFFPESANVLKRFHVVNIGLREEYIQSLSSNYALVEISDIKNIYKKRAPFSHKGTYGHAFIYAGSPGKIGAALLCAEACVYAGAGLTSVCLPADDRAALYTRLPEAMYLSYDEALESNQWSKFSAIALGPGITVNLDRIETILTVVDVPLVLDAGALTFLAEDSERFIRLSSLRDVVISPHMKEFDRMFGESRSWWERLQKALSKAMELQVTIVLKNRYTFIVLPEGKVLINPTGNPAMASGGMGDVLTGIIVSFLAQGYSTTEACILGCYFHGRAGDVLAQSGHAIVPPTKLIAQLPLTIGEVD